MDADLLPPATSTVTDPVAEPAVEAPVVRGGSVARRAALQALAVLIGQEVFY